MECKKLLHISYVSRDKARTVLGESGVQNYLYEVEQAMRRKQENEALETAEWRVQRDLREK
jgi:hypothetical protein